MFVLYARLLAQHGHPVLRFDYMGNGDSTGDFSASSLATMRADVRRAIEQVRRLAGDDRVNLLGLRFGATLASLVAEELPAIHQLVLWAPIVDGDRYMQDTLRINVTTQVAAYAEVRHDRPALVESMRQGRTVNVDGYELSFPLYSEISHVRLAAHRKTHRGRCFIVQIDRVSDQPASDLQELAASYENAVLTSAQEEPFWKEIARSYQRPAPNLFAATSEWLDATPDDVPIDDGGGPVSR